MKNTIESLGQLSDINDNELQAVKRAMDFEAKGTFFYALLRDAVSDQKEKTFFDLLANMEHEHYQALKETATDLAGPDKWFNAI